MRTTTYTNPAAILMTKIPQREKIKTRLVPALSPSETEELSWCFLRDTINRLEFIGLQNWFAVTPASCLNELSHLITNSNRVFDQQGDNLGSRMHHAFKQAFDHGHKPVVLIGSDLPTLPTAHITDSIRILQNGNADIVFTPTRDGGFGLVAMANPSPGLMDCVEWSSPTTLQQVLTRARYLRLRWSLLPEWYDIDVGEDLVTLRHELETSEAARNAAPHTWRWMKRYAHRNNHPNP